MKIGFAPGPDGLAPPGVRIPGSGLMPEARSVEAASCAAAGARGSSSGASGWRARSARRSATRSTGGARCPASATRRRRVYVLGLAPAAHGGNRTGRVFTGDRSGDWLFASLHRTGFANQPTSTHAGRRPAPRRRVHRRRRPLRPAGQQAAAGRARQLPALRGGGARAAAARRDRVPRRLRAGTPPAGCSACGRGRASATGPSTRSTTGPVLLGSYHPSQQNTFTGKLTEPMLDAIFAQVARARRPPC